MQWTTHLKGTSVPQLLVCVCCRLKAPVVVELFNNKLVLFQMNEFSFDTLKLSSDCSAEMPASLKCR